VDGSDARRRVLSGYRKQLSGNGKVPLFSVAIVIVLLILSMLVFARLVHRLTHLQITHVLAFIGRRGRSVIRAMFPRLDAPQAAAESWQSAMERIRDRPPTQVPRYSGEPRVVTRVALDTLARQAEAADAVIVLECAVGDTLVEDSLLLRVHGARALLVEEQLRKTIQLARERTFEQDPRYALRLLVDIAIRALSPAINDPTTAVQAIDQIEDLLRRLGRLALDAGCLTDRRGTLRVVFPTPSWEDYLSLGFDEIRHYGADSVQVMRRLRAALLGLEESVTEVERGNLVKGYLQQLDRTVRYSIQDAQEQLTALREDRQGLGPTRWRPASEQTEAEH